MSSLPANTVRHAATLAELAEIGMVMARACGADVAAGTPEAKVQAIANFPKVARCVRQTLALEARFVRDAERAEREDVQVAARERDMQRRRTKARVRQHFQRVLYERFDSDDEADETLDAWSQDLRDCLHDDILDPEVLDLPFEAVVERIHRELGLPAVHEAADDETPDAPDDDAPNDAGPDDAGPDDEGPGDEGPGDEGPDGEGAEGEGPVDEGPADTEPADEASVDATPPPIPAPPWPIRETPSTEPYIPPWERLPPYAIWPGGSGY